MGSRSREVALSVLLVAALAALVVATVLATRRQARDAAELRQLAARVDSLEHEGEGEPAREALPRPSLAPSPPAAFAAPMAPGRAFAPPLPLDPARELRQQALLRVELDARFAAQPPAPRVDSAPQQVVAAFNSDSALGALDAPIARNVHCRASSCVIEGVFKVGADPSDWATRVMLELGATLPDYRTVDVPQADGGHEIRIYATRDPGAER